MISILIVVLIAIFATTAIAAPPHRFYKAQKGDTWESIAKYFYHNPQSAQIIAKYYKNPEHGPTVKPGKRVYLPKDLNVITKSTTTKPSEHYSVLDGNARVQYRKQRKIKKSVGLRFENTFYDCDGKKGAKNLNCRGPSVSGSHRDEKRIDKDANSQKTTIGAGYAWRQYGQTPTKGYRTRDTQRLGVRGIWRQSESYKPSKGTRGEKQTTISVTGGLERKIYLNDKWAFKVGAFAQVPIAVLDHSSDYNNKYRDEASVGAKAEVQYKLSQKVMLIASAGVWKGFHKGNTTLTPTLGVRFNDIFEIGIGAEFEKGQDPTQIIYAKVLWEKWDRTARQKSHKPVTGGIESHELEEAFMK